MGNIVLNWDDLTSATSYNVYSSPNPYGTFTFLAALPLSEYTYTEVGTHKTMFFYITGTNNTKESPKIIEVKKDACK